MTAVFLFVLLLAGGFAPKPPVNPLDKKLLQACADLNANAVKSLLEQGASANAKDDSGDTALI